MPQRHLTCAHDTLMPEVTVSRPMCLRHRSRVVLATMFASGRTPPCWRSRWRVAAEATKLVPTWSLPSRVLRLLRRSSSRWQGLRSCSTSTTSSPTRARFRFRRKLATTRRRRRRRRCPWRWTLCRRPSTALCYRPLANRKCSRRRRAPAQRSPSTSWRWRVPAAAAVSSRWRPLLNHQQIFSCHSASVTQHSKTWTLLTSARRPLTELELDSWRRQALGTSFAGLVV